MISKYRPTRPDSTVTCRYCSAEIGHACSSSVMYSNMKIRVPRSAGHPAGAELGAPGSSKHVHRRSSAAY